MWQTIGSYIVVLGIKIVWLGTRFFPNGGNVTGVFLARDGKRLTLQDMIAANRGADADAAEPITKKPLLRVVADSADSGQGE